MIKTSKMEIYIYDDNSRFEHTQKESNDIVFKQIRQLQYEASKAANKITTYLYAAGNNEHIMQKYEKIEKIKEMDLYGKTRNGYTYDIAKGVMKSAPSIVIGGISKMAREKFRKDSKQVYSGNRSLANYRRDMALPIQKTGYWFVETDNGPGVMITLFNRDGSKEHGMKDGRITFAFNNLDNSRKSILYRVMSGEYEKSSASLSYNKKKRKWMFGISYGVPVKEEKTFNNIMGIDVGIHNAMAFAVWNPEKEDYERVSYRESLIPGGELQTIQAKYQRLQRSYGRETKWASDNNIGHGYKARMSRAERTRERESNYRDTYNHKISRYIIEEAKKYGCGLIQMEDLGKFNPQNAFLKRWPYYDLQQKIAYKAEEAGVQVAFVNPAYTSRRCSKCGTINQDIDSTSIHEWTCPECGAKHDRDLNAAKNIALPNIEAMITEKLPA